MIRSLVPLGFDRTVEELLDEEDDTRWLAMRYARKALAQSALSAVMAATPGSVGLAGQRVPIRVPRILPCHGARMYIHCGRSEALHGDRAVNDLLLRRVLYGISCADCQRRGGRRGDSRGDRPDRGTTVSRAIHDRPARRNFLAKLQELGPLRGGRCWPWCLVTARPFSATVDPTFGRSRWASR